MVPCHQWRSTAAKLFQDRSSRGAALEVKGVADAASLEHGPDIATALRAQALGAIAGIRVALRADCAVAGAEMISRPVPSFTE
jgi:hypothetical protein